MTTPAPRIRQWLSVHPLAAVLAAAVVVRLIAVIWSRGFIHSDDFYDTVMIAHDWLTGGLWGSDGWLTWRGEPPSSIGRFPLYTLSLWAVMKAHWAVGVTSLESMMYTIRALHAALSLLPVWVSFRVTEWITGRKAWAVFAGLFVALNYAQPFLGVRNLIEVVGGNLWIVVVYLLYRWQARDRRARFLLLAGIVTGLAWMIRFQLAFAALPVPLVLWYLSRSLRPSLWYGAGVVVMLLLSGLTDWMLLGRFAGSTITNISMNAGLPALYDTIPLLYVVLLILMLVPPWSALMLWWTFRASFWREHLLLLTTSWSFLLCHSLLSNQQERFVFPILPAFMLAAVLATWHRQRSRGYLLRSGRLLRALIGASVVLNTALLALLTPAYGKKGLIEPVLEIRERQPDARVLFVQPEMRYYIPIHFGGPDLERFWLRDWPALERLRLRSDTRPDFDFVVLYPPGPDALPSYVDSAETVAGPLEPSFAVPASAYDRLLHTLNPTHNPLLAAWVYEPAGRADR